MQVTKIVTTIITSLLEIKKHQDDYSKVNPIMNFDVEIQRYPPDKIESFGFYLSYEIVFSPYNRYLFECKDELFYENDQKRPDIEFFLSSTNHAISQRIGYLLWNELKQKEIFFLESSILEIKQDEIKEKIQMEMDRAYRF